MTREDLKDAIRAGEGPCLEFKLSLSKNVGRELCAFANARGGSLLVGVSDDGAIVGVPHHNRLKSRIQSFARSADPPIKVDIDAIGNVLRVTVPAQDAKPYSFGGRFFRRAGASSQQMSATEIEDMFYEVGRLQFDRKPCPYFEIERDLDDATWDRFSRGAKIPKGMDRLAALRNLGLITSGQRMTHAGAWLLAEDIRTVTTSAHVSCALFLGQTKSRILDRRDFHRHMAALVDDVTTWILTKINVELVIEHVRREERPELPEDALREAVANAVAHRDYRSPANVQVYVFKDRVEIVSPGGLPAGMTEADLGTTSVPRNPLLFGLLYRMGVVEHIGSGIRRILDRCRAHGAPRPRIDVSEHRVRVTFPRPVQPGTSQGQSSVRGPELRQDMLAPSGRGPESSRSTPASIERSARGSAQPTGRSLERRVMALLVGGPLSKSAIAQSLGHRSVSGGLNRVIRRLRQGGFLEYTLPEKPNSSRQEYRLRSTGPSAR